MKNKHEARKLAEQMIRIGKLAQKETVCILTDMDEPLGKAVGNVLEVIEALQVLKGESIPDVEDVVLELGAYMMKLAGKGEEINNNKQKLKENLKNGKAYQKFLELVQKQGGDISYIEDVNKFKKANVIEPVYSEKSGYICEMNAKKIGELACHLGAGRIKKEDIIDTTVGVVIEKKIGQKVERGELLGYVHAKNLESAEIAKQDFLNIVKIENEKIENPEKILEVIVD